MKFPKMSQTAIRAIGVVLMIPALTFLPCSWIASIPFGIGIVLISCEEDFGILISKWRGLLIVSSVGLGVSILLFLLGFIIDYFQGPAWRGIRDSCFFNSIPALLTLFALRKNKSSYMVFDEKTGEVRIVS